MYLVECDGYYLKNYGTEDEPDYAFTFKASADRFKTKEAAEAAARKLADGTGLLVTVEQL